MKKSLKLLTILIVAVLSIGMIGMLVGCKPKNLDDKRLTYEYKLKKPSMSATSAMPEISIPEKDSDAAKKLAYDLYTIANANDKGASSRMMYGFAPSINKAAGMDNCVDVYLWEIKQDTEYFRVDYRTEYNIPLFNAMPSMKKNLNESLNLILTERKYYNTSMDKMVYQSVKNAKVENGEISAIWPKDAKNADEVKSTGFATKEMDAPIFNASQSGNSLQIKHTVTTDTISKASITKEKDYYTVEVVLDVKNPETTKNTVQDIRDGSGDQKAEYTSIAYTFTIWDNGFFRTANAKEEWKGKAAGMIGISSSFDWNWQFVYGIEKSEFDLSKFAPAQEIRAEYNK